MSTMIGAAGTESSFSHDDATSEGISHISRRPLLADAVAKRLEDMIASGELPPGQQLPSEAVLAERFGVARSTIREAKKALAHIGLLDIHVGKGSFVQQSAVQRLDLARVFDRSRTSLAEIYEGRGILESAIAALAAERATPQDIRDMRLAQERLEDAVQAGDAIKVFAADTAFHIAVVRAAHNEYLYRAFDGTRGLIQEVIASTYQVPGSVGQTSAFHRKLLNAIEAHDPLAARDLMRQLTEASRRTLESRVQQIPVAVPGQPQR